ANKLYLIQPCPTQGLHLPAFPSEHSPDGIPLLAPGTQQVCCRNFKTVKQKKMGYILAILDKYSGPPKRLIPLSWLTRSAPRNVATWSSESHDLRKAFPGE